jgi:hypothetical protein
MASSSASTVNRSSHPLVYDALALITFGATENIDSIGLISKYLLKNSYYVKIRKL